MQDEAPRPCGQLLCQHDSYLRNCETRVLSVETAAAPAPEAKKKQSKKKPQPALARVVLQDTVFFPEGGGQHPDTGIITFESADGLKGRLNVLNVQNEAGCAVHTIEAGDASKLEVGSIVSCEVNWERRWGFMQQHSAQHLITAVAQEMFGAPTEAWGCLTLTLILTLHPAGRAVRRPAAGSGTMEPLLWTSG